MQHVAAVPVVLVMRDHQSDLVQLRGPAEQSTFALQQSLLLDLVEQGKCGLADAPAVFHVYVMPLHQLQHGDGATILVQHATDQIVQHALA